MTLRTIRRDSFDQERSRTELMRSAGAGLHCMSFAGIVRQAQQWGGEGDSKNRPCDYLCGAWSMRTVLLCCKIRIATSV